MRKYRNIQNKKNQTYKVLRFRHIKFELNLIYKVMST